MTRIGRRNCLLLIIISYCSILSTGCFFNATLTKNTPDLDSTSSLTPKSLQVPTQISVNEGDALSIVLELDISNSVRNYHYEMISGTAIGGVHFVVSSGTIFFSGTDTLKTISVPTMETGITDPAGKIFLIRFYTSANNSAGETRVQILPVNQITKVVDFYPVKAAPLTFIDMGTYIIYVGKNYSTGSELWRTDGTANGTYQLKDICPGLCSSGISSLVKLGTVAYFVARDTDGGKLGIFKSDGTSLGTSKIFDLSQISVQTGFENSETLINAFYCELECNSSRYLLATSSRLFFALYNSAVLSGYQVTWFSTQGSLGTTISTTPINDSPWGTAVFNDRLFVTAEDSIYTWDGIGSGTKSFVLTGGFPCSGGFTGTYIITGNLFFICNDNYGSSGKNVVKMNSSFSYTMAGNINMVAESFTYSRGKDYLYYDVFDGANFDVYRSDGTPGNAIKLLDGAGFASAFVLGIANNKTIFTRGTNVYQSDGTLVGTTLIHTALSTSYTRLGSIGTFLYFYSDQKIYRTDGTTIGTTVVTSTDGENFDFASLLYERGGEIFFEGVTSSRGSELWKITSAGVLQMATERNVGAAHSFPTAIYSLMGTDYVSMANGWDSGLYNLAFSSPLIQSGFKNWGEPSVSEDMVSFQDVNGKLYWTQNSPVHASEPLTNIL